MRSVDRRPDWDGHRRTEVAAWIRRGLAVGAKILYIEPRAGAHVRSLSGLLENQPEAVRILAVDPEQGCLMEALG
jgi:hypothetical protein